MKGVDQELFDLYKAALIQEYELKVSEVIDNEYQVQAYLMYPALEEFIKATGTRLEDLGNQTTIYTYALGPKK